MAKTIVGLFESGERAKAVVRDLENAGIAHSDIRIITEPRSLPVSNMMATPHTDFEVDLRRELRELGASDQEAEACVQGVKRRGALVFAVAPAETASSAAEIMGRHAETEVESSGARDLHIANAAGDTEEHMGPREPSVQAGRWRSPGGGPKVFRW